MANSEEGTATKRFTASLPPPKKLDFSIRSELQNNWKRFHRQWKNYSVASRLQEEPLEFQTAVFMTCVGDEALDALEVLSLTEEDRQDLSKVIDALEKFCVGETNEVFESYTFHKRDQRPGESVDEYFTELKQLAKKCAFKDEDRMIRDRLVIGINDDKTREKLLEKKKLTPGEALNICRAQEQAVTQLRQMSTIPNGIDGIGNKSVNRVQSGVRRKFSSSTQSHKKEGHKDCSRCGRKHIPGRCPARGEKCNACGKVGHFAGVCKTKKKKNKVHELEASEEEDAYLGTVTSSKDSPWKAKVLVNGKDMAFKIDTGADITVIPEKFVPPGVNLEQISRKFYGPGHTELKAMGKFKAKLQLPSGNSATQDIYVLKGQKEALLGRPAIQALKMIKRVNLITEPEEDEEESQNASRSNNTRNATNFKDQFPELFTGLGKLEKEYMIELKENVTPFSVSTPRRVALPLQKKVEEELRRLQEEDIITEVHSPTDWCAPMVVVPKANGSVRICVDLTKLNESVRRENYPLPTTDQLLAQLSGATVFTKLDCNKGFHQVPLAPESQELTTFITPFGRFAYKRMPFGISSGPEIFHREMSHLLAGIPGVICNIDDTLVCGKTQQEHDERLHEVLRRLQKANMTLNDKCLFSVSRVKFLGHIVSTDGIEVDPSKLEAITQMPQPQNVSDVRRLLGMVNQLGKFVENLSTMTEPLRQLLKKENAWVWTPSQENAFQNIKEALSTAPVLAHYDTNSETKVSSDASKSGLGSVLLQRNGQDWKPIMYASRSMTSTEQRYAQIEKEALAATWACEKFSDFLIGLKSFQIETDHKPLVPLLQKKSLNDLPPRIQRFRMRLMRFSFTVIHTPGKDLHTADALSRAPVNAADEDEVQKEEENIQIFVNTVIQSLPASKQRLEEVKVAQDQEEAIKLAKEFCTAGWPETVPENEIVKKQWHARNSLLKKLWAVRHEITVNHGLLLYNSRLVIPQSLQGGILSKIHEGHQGIVKCRAMAKMSVWWPGISKEIEELIKKCSTCEKYKDVHPEPLRPSKTPDYPFQKTGMDLFEWEGQQYLLIVDYYSRWIELALLRKTTSQSTIEHCRSIFSRYGIPETVISDNGPQFSSCEFAKFAESYGFEHRTSSPRHPQGNGEAERAVQTIKRLLKKSADPYIAMLNYRTTPLKQGLSPAELLMGRRLRSKVPILPSKLKPQKVNVKWFKIADQREKNQQKRNFDQRHRAQPLPNLDVNTPVWVKTPNTQQAVVKKTANRHLGEGERERSYLVETPSGTQRRNRLHLRKRSPHQLSEEAQQPPQVTSLLPTQRDRSPRPTEQADEDTSSSPQSHNECSFQVQGGQGKTKSSLPRTVSSDTSPPSQHTLRASATNHTYTTRSGREIKPPKKYTL